LLFHLISTAFYADAADNLRIKTTHFTPSKPLDLVITDKF